MQKIIMLLLFLSITAITFGQEKKEFLDEIRGIKVTAPKFAGPVILSSENDEGEFATLKEYLAKNIQYPEESKKWGKEGTEIVQFVISPRGEISDFNIINSISPEIDEEVVRVLKTTNRMWNPGMKNGSPVAMEKEVSIAFNISVDDNPANSTNFLKHAKKNFNIGSKKFFIKENNKSALRYYNKAIQYLPNDKAILVARGMCRYELGNNNGACQDWNRVKTLGGFEGDVFLKDFCDFKGYNEMLSILQE